jgi:putative ABC transport system substrate-binding protein
LPWALRTRIHETAIIDSTGVFWMEFLRRRRDFIMLLGGAAAAWPLAARAQPPAMPVIGVLDFGWPESSTNLVAGFHKGLNETGFIEGRNVGIEFRWAENDNARLTDLAADLVRRQVAVIAAMAGTPALAARATTTTIPVVFNTAGDPVRMGLVASLNRPGGNVTGVANLHMQLAAKRFGFLHELLPRATRLAVLVNPNSRNAQSEVADAQTSLNEMSPSWLPRRPDCSVPTLPR